MHNWSSASKRSRNEEKQIQRRAGHSVSQETGGAHERKERSSQSGRYVVRWAWYRLQLNRDRQKPGGQAAISAAIE